MFKPVSLLCLALALVFALCGALAEPVIEWSARVPTAVEAAPEYAAIIYEFGGHSYVLYDHSGLSWPEAEALCEEYGGHLACPNSYEEQKFLEVLVKNGTLNTYWLGGRRDDYGRFVWLDGQPMEYTNWDVNMPDNHLGVENYMQMYRVPNPESEGSAAFAWNDAPRDNDIPGSEFFLPESVGFLCEWEGVHHAYELVDTPMTWEDAELYCKARGGHLASVHSDGDQAALAQLVAGGSLGMYWLGGYRVGEDSFAWSDGSDFDYTHWDAGAPDNHLGIERFVQIYRVPNPEVEGSAAFAWNDAPNDNTLPGSLVFTPQSVGLICQTIDQPWVE